MNSSSVNYNEKAIVNCDLLVRGEPENLESMGKAGHYGNNN